jgi:hypothetical protein
MVLEKNGRLMMRNILLFICSTLLFSCNSDKSENKSVDIPYDSIWILDNEELKSILSDYIHIQDDKPVHENYYIYISHRVINDSTCSYTLMAWMDINFFTMEPPQVLFQFENRLVCCHIFGLDIFKMNDDFLVDFMRKNYPDQYEYYLKAGFYPPVITGGGLVWELIFQDNCLISRREFYDQ